MVMRSFGLPNYMGYPEKVQNLIVPWISSIVWESCGRVVGFPNNMTGPAYIINIRHVIDNNVSAGCYVPDLILLASATNDHVAHQSIKFKHAYLYLVKWGKRMKWKFCLNCVNCKHRFVQLPSLFPIFNATIRKEDGESMYPDSKLYSNNILTMEVQPGTGALPVNILNILQKNQQRSSLI